MTARLKGLRFLALGALLAAGLATASPSNAAPQPADRPASCPASRSIENWKSAEQLERKGFHIEQFGGQASLAFPRDHGDSYAALDLAANPASNAYTASRISELDGTLPIAARTKCWQASERRAVVAEYTVRFDQAAPSALTENMFFWNSPLPAKGSSEPSRLLTTFGVARGSSGYQAIAVQDLDFSTFSFALYDTRPMPAWLNAADWHTIRVTIAQGRVSIEVAQGTHAFTSVLDAALPHPAEPLGFEVSIDNEPFPGVIVPIAAPDGIDITDLDIHLRHERD